MVTDRKTDRVAEALTQMSTLIERFVKNSLRGDLYEKALECLKEMRVACVKEDEAGRFNEFAKRVKKVFAQGPHEGFWELVVQGGVTLITHKESPTSSFVTDQEAQDFLQAEQKPKEEAPKKKPQEDDLMDEIE
jgi:ATP-dependent DNA helicase 2 subunit 2